MRAVVADTFKAQQEKVKKLRSALVAATYEHLYSKDLQKAMEDLQKKSGGIAFKDSTSLYVYFSGKYQYFELDEPRLMTYAEPQSRYIKAGIPLYEQWEKYEAAASALNTEKKELRTKVNAIVDSVTTVKKLLEVWPEAVTWIDSIADSEDFAPVPAVAVESVNELISKNKEKE